MIFETQLRAELDSLLSDQNSQLLIDNVERIDEDCLLVTFHLSGAWGGPASFTFPLSESVPLENSLAALEDMISRNWNTAHIAPKGEDEGHHLVTGAAN